MEKIAAVAIIENSNNQLLLLNRNVEPLGWCLVGGNIDINNESVVDGIVREIQEEIGVKVDKKNLEYVKDSVSESGKNVKVYKLLTKIDKITLSPEHSGYMFTSKIDDTIKLAGKTIDFLDSYKFDSDYADWKTVVGFGKYKGRNVYEILNMNGLNYLLWLHNKTEFKLCKSVLDFIVNLDNRNRSEIEEYRNAELVRKSNEAYYKRNIEKSVETPYGRAIESCGNHHIINEDGSYTGEICHNYFGWHRGAWEDDN